MSTTNPTSRGDWPSASAGEANKRCRKRHLAQIGIPEPEQDPDAESGSAIHAAWAGKPYRELTPDEQESLEALKSRETEILAAWLGEPRPTADLIIHREIRLWDTWGYFKCSGQADVLYIWGNSALVIDGKRGRAKVTPEPQNIQLRWLAALVPLNYPQVDEVTVALAQHWSPKSPPCIYDKYALCIAVSEMEEDVEACYSPDAEYNPGSPQCDYCKAKVNCPAFAKASLPVPFSAPPPTAKDIQEAIALLPGDRLGAFLALVRMANEVADGETRKRLAAGQKVDGWKMSPGRVRETVNNPQEVFNRFVLMGGKTEQFLTAVSIAKGKLKDAVRGVTQHKGKQLESEIESMLDGCVESKQSAMILERE